MKRRYLESLAAELAGQSNRVRDLIGSRHWLSDGHHKEHLLAELMKRHVPGSVHISRGFVIGPGTDACSGEQDLLLIDGRYSRPVFDQGDLVVATPGQVLAAVSVKTKLSKQTLTGSLNSLCTVLEVFSRVPSALPPLLAAFFYELAPEVEKEPTRVYEYVSAGLTGRDSPNGDQLMAESGPITLASARDLLFVVNQPTNSEPYPRIRGYHCNGLSTGQFVTTILDFVAKRLGGDSDLVAIAEDDRIAQLSPASAPLVGSSRRR